MTGAKMILLTGIAFQTTLAVSEPAAGGLLEVYKTGGIVAVLLVLLTVVYLDGRKRQAKLEAILEENAKATQSHADATRTQTAAVFEMSQTVQSVVTLCAQARGVQLPPAHAPRIPQDRQP